MRLARDNPDWAIGFEDETWWSRVAQPALNSWTEAGKPLRLVEQLVAKDDPDPKAISCYGLLLPESEEVWLRFVDGRPVSGITTRFLWWCCERLQALGKKVLLLISGTTLAGTRARRSGAGSENITERSKGAGLGLGSSAAFCPRRARG